jgi:hypothetical protein
MLCRHGHAQHAETNTVARGIQVWAASAPMEADCWESSFLPLACTNTLPSTRAIDLPDDYRQRTEVHDRAARLGTVSVSHR